jgi:ABC-type Na+ transport system ATPase subunit NatA
VLFDLSRQRIDTRDVNLRYSLQVRPCATRREPTLLTGGEEKLAIGNLFQTYSLIQSTCL